MTADTLAEIDAPRGSSPSTSTEQRGVGNRLWRLATGYSTLSIADQVLVSGVNFVTVVLIGRFCSKEELGVYSLAFTGVLFARCIQETLMTGPYTYLRHRNRDAAGGYAGSVLMHHITFSALASCALLVLAAAGYVLRNDWPLLPLVVLLAAIGPLMLLKEFARQICFAHLRIRQCLLLDGVAAGAQLAAVAALIAVDRLSIATVYLAMGAAAAVPSLTWLWISRREFQARRDRWRADLAQNWDFGRWLLAGHLLGSVSPFIVPWALVGTAHGVEAVGILAASAGVAGLSNTLVVGLNNLLTPRAAVAFADGGIGALQNVLLETGLLLVGVLAVFSLVFLFLGSTIAVALYGPTYADAGPVIALLSLGMLLLGVSIVAGNGLCVMGYPSANLKADVVSFVALVLATALLVAPYGVKGAAAVSLIANAAGMVVRVLTFLRLAQQQRHCIAAEGSALA